MELRAKGVLEIEVQAEGAQDLHFEAVKMRGILAMGLHENVVLSAVLPQVDKAIIDEAPREIREVLNMK